jgi:hypothetical protein
MFIDGDTVHLFVPHRWERALHLTFKEAACETFPTANVIKAAVS